MALTFRNALLLRHFFCTLLFFVVTSCSANSAQRHVPPQTHIKHTHEKAPDEALDDPLKVSLQTQFVPTPTQVLLKKLEIPSAKIQQQRILYASALDAVEQKQFERLRSFRHLLRDYPLVAYLDYAKVTADEAALTPANRNWFKRTYGDYFLSRYVNNTLLSQLGKDQDWLNFLKFNTSKKSDSRQCQILQAHISLKTWPQSKLLKHAKKRWLVGKSQPNVCDPVFDWLMQQPNVNKMSLYSQRARLALARKNRKLANYLAKSSSAAVQKEVADWEVIQNNPALIFTQPFKKNTNHHRALAIYAANLFLSESLEEAENAWAQLKRKYKFTQTQSNTFEAKMAKRAGQRHYADALRRFQALPEGAMDDVIHEWSVRSAIRVQNWQGVRAQILTMPKALQNKSEWQYWLARAEAGLGNTANAKALYSKAIDERGYYGFLSAERLNAPYRFKNEPSAPTKMELRTLLERLDVQRIREWVFHQQFRYARAELKATLKKLNTSEKIALAHIVQHWGWHEQSIRIMAGIKRFNDIPLRFALAYRPAIEQYSQRVGIDPDWAQAIMRRESGYAFDARSGVGARGLMQLMPRTAQGIAKQEGWEWEGLEQLMIPEVNIRYGTTYLGQVSEEFANYIPLVTSSYNAGPHRTRKWLPKGEDMPLDVWIATIPFKETRKYVQAVSEYMTVFKWRASGEPDDFGNSLNYTKKVVTPTASNKI